MFEREENERGPQRISLLALGLAAAAMFAACDNAAAPAPEKGSDNVKDSDDDDDKGDDDDDDDDAPPAKDAGKKDASKPAVEDAAKPDAGSVVSDASTPDKSAVIDTDWCKAKAVFDEYCIACHDGKGGGGSPMGLTSIADLQADAVKTKGKKVYEVVGTRVHDTKNPMPPQVELSADELAAIDKFVAAKAPAGDNPTCSGQTAPTKDDDVWPPPECDEVYKIYAHGSTLDSPYMVPAGDEYHPQIIWDAPWGNEKVQMIQVRPITDNSKVLHHWILYANAGAGAFLTGWAPGDNERTQYPPDIGMNMPTGKQSLRLDMHYFNTMGTQTEPDKSGLEICIVKGDHLRPKAAAVTMGFTSVSPVLAPAGAVNKPVTGTCQVQTTSPVTLMTASPHAHKYAVHMKFTVKKKSGTEIVMLDKDFKFGEQKSYNLPDPGVVIETGDTVYTNCYYTNPTSKNIGFGESTTDEMCFNFASYWPAGALSCGLGGIFGLP